MQTQGCPTRRSLCHSNRVIALRPSCFVALMRASRVRERARCIVNFVNIRG